MPRAFIIELPCLEHSAIGHAAHLVEMLRSANLVASRRRGGRAPRFGWRWVDGQGRPLPAMPHATEGAAAEGPAQAVFVSDVLDAMPEVMPDLRRFSGITHEFLER